MRNLPLAPCVYAPTMVSSPSDDVTPEGETVSFIFTTGAVTVPLPASVHPPKPSETELAERAPPSATVMVPVPLAKRTEPVLVHVEPLPTTEILPTAPPKYPT